MSIQNCDLFRGQYLPVKRELLISILRKLFFLLCLTLGNKSLIQCGFESLCNLISAFFVFLTR